MKPKKLKSNNLTSGLSGLDTDIRKLPSTDIPPKPPMPQWYIDAMVAHYRVERIRKHAEAKRTWPWWARALHWTFLSWGCEACQAQRKEGLFKDG